MYNLIKLEQMQKNLQDIWCNKWINVTIENILLQFLLYSFLLKDVYETPQIEKVLGLIPRLEFVCRKFSLRLHGGSPAGIPCSSHKTCRRGE